MLDRCFRGTNNSRIKLSGRKDFLLYIIMWPLNILRHVPLVLQSAPVCLHTKPPPRLLLPAGLCLCRFYQQQETAGRSHTRRPSTYCYTVYYHTTYIYCVTRLLCVCVFVNFIYLIVFEEKKNMLLRTLKRSNGTWRLIGEGDR